MVAPIVVVVVVPTPPVPVVVVCCVVVVPVVVVAGAGAVVPEPCEMSHQPPKIIINTIMMPITQAAVLLLFIG